MAKAPDTGALTALMGKLGDALTGLADTVGAVV
jgi:hypothetical protein